MSTPSDYRRLSVDLTNAASYWLRECHEILDMPDEQIIELAVVSLRIQLAALRSTAMEKKKGG